MLLSPVGLQSWLPQDVPLWYVNCFELRAILVLGPEKLLPLLDYLEEPELGALEDYHR